MSWINVWTGLDWPLARQRAAELERAEAERPGNMEFEAGKELYGVGRYVEAEEIFMQALDLSGPYTKLGGEIQLWLALAYQVCTTPPRSPSHTHTATFRPPPGHTRY